ncbi:MAG: PaaI family thioesterase [Proteobacteria bacterium]|nr:PaaI family thioesterase [Pseudomonadota bacterium]
MSEQDSFVRRFTHWEASAMQATGAWAERRRLADAMRTVIQRLAESDAPEQELAAAADALERYAEQLATHPRGKKYEGWSETGPAGSVGAFFDQSPLIGRANPLAPPIQLGADQENKRVEGRVTFGSSYEGPPGCVHGGFVAAAFDEVLGFANSLSGNPGMTARLTVNYRRPTPLLTPLRFEAGLDRVEGRKIFTSGRVYVGDTDQLTAEAEGLFVSVDRSKFIALFEERQRRAEARSDEAT